MAARPGRSSDQFIVRLPDGMRDTLKEAAEANNRSMNAEVVARLLLTFDESFLPLSDLGVMALLKRFDAGVSLLEEMLMAHHRRGLEQFIDHESKAGNELTRTAAVVAIVERYLAEHGYSGGKVETAQRVPETQRLAEDVRKIISLIDAEIAGNEGSAGDPVIETELGERLTNAIAERTTLAMEMALKAVGVKEPSATSAALRYLAPFIRARESSVMQAIANGDLSAAVEAAGDAERLRDVGT